MECLRVTLVCFPVCLDPVLQTPCQDVFPEQAAVAGGSYIKAYQSLWLEHLGPKDDTSASVNSELQDIASGKSLSKLPEARILLHHPLRLKKRESRLPRLLL